MKTRTKWIRRSLWVVGFGCLWLNVLDDPPLHSGAYVQGVSASEATIAIITAEPRTVSIDVLLGDREVAHDFSPTDRRRHAFRFTGLKAGAAYRYRLREDDGTADPPVHEGTFRTAPDRDDAAVRFAFCGDSGDQPWWVWLQRTPILHLPARWQWFSTKSAVTGIGAAMAEWQPDFALHLGDVIYPKGLHAHYSSGFFRPFGRLIRDVPFFPVLGNHDVMNAAGQQALANFHLPENAMTGDGRCFSFAWGPVRIIGLDCNTHLTGDAYREDHPTHRFLIDELQACSEPWVVVASHFPMRSASRQKNRGDLLRDLLPALARYGVSLYLSGHDHCYQRFGPGETLPVPLVVSGGGGKRLYDITENPRERQGAEALAKAYHWCAVEVERAAMVVTAWGLDGERLDRFELALPGADQLDAIEATNPARAARIRKL